MSEQTMYMQQLPGGICFAHGPYKDMECPKWPACATDPQVEEYRKMAAPAATPAEPLSADRLAHIRKFQGHQGHIAEMLDEIDRLRQELARVADPMQTKAWEWDVATAELDKLGVPTTEGEDSLGLWGRIDLLRSTPDAPGLRELVEKFVKHADDGAELPDICGGCGECARLFDALRTALATSTPAQPSRAQIAQKAQFDILDEAVARIDHDMNSIHVPGKVTHSEDYRIGLQQALIIIYAMGNELRVLAAEKPTEKP
jgi:hypothetical protein